MTKRYMRIGEAAQMLGVSTQTMRAWDASGELPADRRSMAGTRFYERKRMEDHARGHADPPPGPASGWRVDDWIDTYIDDALAQVVIYLTDDGADPADSRGLIFNDDQAPPTYSAGADGAPIQALWNAIRNAPDVRGDVTTRPDPAQHNEGMLAVNGWGAFFATRFETIGGVSTDFVGVGFWLPRVNWCDDGALVSLDDLDGCGFREPRMQP